MSIPIHNLTTAQKAWYARLVIAAILADNKIDVSETEFLKQVFSNIGEVNDKKQLMNSIATKKAPILSAPEGIQTEILAAIYIELILILISDLNFDTKEKYFLKKVSELFNFTDNYFITMIKWAEEGLAWKISQKDLFENTTENFQIPIDSLSHKQKIWYANALIASIICDGAVDKEEVAFIKMATSFIKDPKERKNLLAFVRNRVCPPIENIPYIPREILDQIFVESMLIISADENISYKEQVYLKRLAKICGFSNEKHDHLLQWCHRGINWKQTKNNLIATCEIKKKAEAKNILAKNRQINSIIDKRFNASYAIREKNLRRFN